MSFFDNLIHLPNKIFAPALFKDKKIHEQFQKNGYYFENNADNIEICKELLKNINFKKVEDLINFKKKNNPKIYSVNISETLNINLYNKIYSYFNSDEKIKLTTSMLGYKTKLRNVSILLNFYNEKNIKDEGPKMYHRDSDSLHDQVKIFMLVNNISDNCGMFYFVPNIYINKNLKLPLESDRKNLSQKDKWRNYDRTINNALKKFNFNSSSAIQKLKGKQGETLYMDTGKVYHKGGYVSEKNKYRVLIQVVYTPVFSLSNWNKFNNKFIGFIQTKLTNLRIKLRQNI